MTVSDHLRIAQNAIDGEATRALRLLEQADPHTRYSKIIEGTSLASHVAAGKSVLAMAAQAAAGAQAHAGILAQIREQQSIAASAFHLLQEQSAAAQISESVKHLVGDYSTLAAFRSAQDTVAAVLGMDLSTGIRTRSVPEMTLIEAAEQSRRFAVEQKVLVDVIAGYSVIDSVAGSLRQVVEPFTHVNGVDSDARKTSRLWEDRLSAQMKAISEPWMLARDPARSVFGYAYLSRISEALRSSPPYSRELNRLFEEDIGGVAHTKEDATPEERDQAALGAGMRPELIAFAPTTFHIVMKSVGLVLAVPPLPVPQPIEGTNPGATYDAAHHEILTQVETRLRNLVEKELSRLGTHWLRDRVGSELRDRWQGRQDEARAKKRPVYSLIHYADLDDLRVIICRRDNWRDAFKSVFHHLDQFTVSMQHLLPLRNDDAHTRPIGRAQTVTLLAEAGRILKSLGVDIYAGKH